MEFLSCCRSLLSKCRRILIGGESDAAVLDDLSPIRNQASTLVRTATTISDVVVRPSIVQEQPNHNVIWQDEMEKGYYVLLEAIYPYVSDVPGAKHLRKQNSVVRNK